MSKELLELDELKQKGLTHLAALLENSEEEEVAGEEEVEDEESKEEVQESSSELEAVLGTLELDESVKTKMKDVFTAAVTAKATELTESKLAELETKVSDKMEAQQEEQDKHIANYLDFVVEGWVKQHEEEVVNEAKVELATSFLSGLKSLFDEHKIVLESDEQLGLIDAAKKEALAAKSELQEALEMLKEAKVELFAEKVKAVISELSEGLTDVQKDRFVSLVGELDVELEEGIESVKERMKQIKDVFVSASASTEEVKESTEEKKEDLVIESEVIEEEKKEEIVEEREEPVVDEKMAAYKAAIKRSVSSLSKR